VGYKGESETLMQPTVDPLVSVVIPAFNEEENIADILAQTEVWTKLGTMLLRMELD